MYFLKKTPSNIEVHVRNEKVQITFHNYISYVNGLLTDFLLFSLHTETETDRDRFIGWRLIIHYPILTPKLSWNKRWWDKTRSWPSLLSSFPVFVCQWRGQPAGVSLMRNLSLGFQTRLHAKSAVHNELINSLCSHHSQNDSRHFYMERIMI